jgi:hypothetical protein
VPATSSGASAVQQAKHGGTAGKVSAAGKALWRVEAEPTDRNAIAHRLGVWRGDVVMGVSPSKERFTSHVGALRALLPAIRAHLPHSMHLQAAADELARANRPPFAVALVCYRGGSIRGTMGMVITTATTTKVPINMLRQFWAYLLRRELVRDLRVEARLCDKVERTHGATPDALICFNVAPLVPWRVAILSQRYL